MNSPKSHYRVVVIGGGIVGASVLYHLARRGWSEVLLIERAELTLSGPHSREILGRLTSEDVSDAALPFLGCRSMDVGLTQATVARLSLTGELGFELTVPAAQQRALWGALLEHGAPLGMRPIGMRAQDSLRLEKGYGVWSREFAQSYTPAMSGLDRFIAYDKGDFLGRAAARKERETGSDQRLVLLAIDALDADVTGFEPVWVGGQRVGFVTSGAYGHHERLRC